jgi:hypothetical protein
MKESYPALYWWKQQGFKKFPTIPLAPIIDSLKVTFMLCIDDHLNGVDNISIAQTPLNTPLEYSLKEIQRRLVLKTARILSNAKVNSLPEATETAMKHLSYIITSAPKPLGHLMNNFFRYEIKQLVKDQYILWGKIVDDAREKIINGEKRAIVLRELGNNVLPKTRGRPSTFSRDELEALRFVYGEMKLSVREIRQSLDLPLQVRALANDDYIREYFVGENPILYAKEGRPEIIDIFEDREIPIVLANKRISDISAEIVRKRLVICRGTKVPTPRTLQDILHGFTPTFAE